MRLLHFLLRFMTWGMRGILSAYTAPNGFQICVLFLGNQGYLEEGTLNFIVGRYYVKLLCFDCEEVSENVLKLFADEILAGIKDRGQVPPLLKAFPKDGLVANSEKFILNNFLGYAFLHDGYLANYKVGDLEFDCFLIEGESQEEAQDMLDQYLAKKEKIIEERSFGYHLKDRYYHNIYLARIKKNLCGVIKIKDGVEEVGEKYLKSLVNALKDNSMHHH
jgi:hypothetical protein